MKPEARPTVGLAEVFQEAVLLTAYVEFNSHGQCNTISLGRKGKSRDACPPEWHIKCGLVYGKDEWDVNAAREGALGWVILLVLSCRGSPSWAFQVAWTLKCLTSPACFHCPQNVIFYSEQPDQRTECCDEDKYNQIGTTVMIAIMAFVFSVDSLPAPL